MACSDEDSAYESTEDGPKGIYIITVEFTLPGVNMFLALFRLILARAGGKG